MSPQFGLFNEPHDRLRHDFLSIHVIGSDGSVVESDSSSVGTAEWVPWAAPGDRVRGIRPRGIVLAGGLDRALDFTEVQVDAPNVLYSAHLYPNRKPETGSIIRN
jgi:hypothetical protein